MIKKDLLTVNNIQNKHLKKNFLRKYSKEYKKIISGISSEIKNNNKTLNILSKNFNFNFKINDLNNFKKFKTIALIGMGGSILGAEAIYNFLQEKIKKRIYFFDDLDEIKITNFKKKENLSKVLFIIISKSGNTVETLSNMFSLNIIKNKSKNIILISEKRNNLIFLLSKKFNIFFIEQKSHIGGRYSVLSEVGIIPGYLMGIDILRLRSKIRHFLDGKEKSFLKDSVIKLACILSSKKLNNLVFINYCPELEKFLFWSQQLIAESLGKKKMGFLPIISNAPKDHHSLLQLYIDGPRDKLFMIFSSERKSKEKVNMPGNIGMNTFLNKKKLSTVKNAQKKALIKTFLKSKIPFREFKIQTINEEVLGKLFSFFIIETVILGKLLKINPFDQPAVEQVKKYTKKLLN